jgi:thiamine biosynthesis lipoprotein
MCCQKQALKKAKHVFYRMDTVVEVTIVQGKSESPGFIAFIKSFFSKNDSKNIENTWEKIDSLLADFEIRFSQTHPKSEVLKINNNPGDFIKISSILKEMVETGLKYGDVLDGMFDLTILPIKELWGFCEKEDTMHVIPSPDTVKSVLKSVNYKKVRVEAGVKALSFEDTTVRIDVGGIAKGFALREVGTLLDEMNYTDYLIVAGGDILAKGKRPDGNAWRIAVKHPRLPEGVLATFRLEKGSVVTSGDYERYWVKDGIRYHHIFNPKTGYSCNENQSVTIWCMDPIVADVLSTGLFCLPKDSIIAFIEKNNGLECVVVDNMGEVAVSKGWRNKIKIY